MIYKFFKLLFWKLMLFILFQGVVEDETVSGKLRLNPGNNCLPAVPS